MFNGNYYTDYSHVIPRNNDLNNYYNRMSRIARLRKVSTRDTIEDKVDNSKTQRSHKRNTYTENLKKYQDYKTKSNEFYKEFYNDFSKLKNSSKKLEIESNDSVYDNRYNSDYIEAEKKVINAVNDFTEDYNNVVRFLGKNESVSEEVKSLSNSYKSIKYNSDELSEIGIDVDYKSGLLSVNSDKLAKAVRNNIKNVRDILGNAADGIATRVYNKTDFAINNSNELFPAAQLETNHINNTYFYNPNNSSIIQSNIAYSTGLLLNYLI